MVTFLITVFAILFIVGIAAYFWQKSAPEKSEYILPARPNARGLFADSGSAAELAISKSEVDAKKQSLIAQARNGERAALNEAHKIGDSVLYDQVLNELLQHADSDSKLLALISYVAQQELPVNDGLARAVVASWQRAPDRSSTAKALHIAALSDNPRIYREAVETALRFWREERLNNVSPIELRALFDGEFWVLSSGSRRSGAGFLLKRTLASARRELEAAARATQ